MLEEERVFQGIFESTRQFMGVLSPEGTLLAVSQAALAFLNLQQEQVIGRPFWETPWWAHDRDQQSRLVEAITKAATGIRVEMESSHISLEGDIRIIDFSLVPLSFTSGEVEFLLAEGRDVTDQFRSRIQLADREERYRVLVENQSDLLAKVDREGRFLMVSPSFCEAFGRSEEELLGQNFMPLIHEDDRQATEESLSQLFRPPYRCLVEHRSLTPSGWRWFSWSDRAILDDSGEVLAIVGVGRDITERKEAEKALALSEAKFRLLFDRSLDGILLLDNDHFSDFNPIVLQMLGISADRMSSMAPWEISPAFQPDGRPSQEKAAEMIALAQERGFHRFEWVHQRFDGTPFPVEVTLIPLPLGGKEVIFTTWRDIRQWTESREKLARSEERFRIAAIQTGQMIYDWDLCTGKILWAGAIEEITGEDPAEFAKVDLSGWGDLIHPEDQERTTKELERCEKDGVPFKAEYRFRHRDGSYRLLDDHGLFLKDPNGVPVRMLGVMADITLRRQDEETLRQAQKMESLGVLAGGIAHDFNNLLTALLGNLNLAELLLDPEASAAPLIKNAEQAAIKAAELTRQMLAYSGRGRFIVQPRDFNRIVREMAQLLQVSLSKKTQLVFELAPDLPPVETDVAQIQQVILNLVTNAADAIGDATGTIRIATSTLTLGAEEIAARFPQKTLAPGTLVVLEVQDSGCGMHPEVVSKIFDPFFSTKPTGHGLGLSAMMGILRSHKGALEITTDPGIGSTFRLFFPASTAVLSESAAPAPLTRSRLTGTVLLVDDEQTIRQTTGLALSSFGLKVVHAVDGVEAIDLFARRKGEIDLIVLDLTMPRMNGAEAFQIIRQQDPEIPVLLCSGFHEGRSLPDLSRERRVEFLRKPYSVEELKQVVERLLG